MPYRKSKVWSIKPPCGTPINSGDPLAFGLCSGGCFIFNEDAGTQTLSSFGVKNIPTWNNSPTWVNGKNGPAVNLVAASAQWLGASDSTFPSGLSPRTMHCIFKMASESAGTTNNVALYGTAVAGQQFGFSVNVDGAGVVSCAIGSNRLATTTSVAAVNQWVDVTLVLPAGGTTLSSVLIYANGVPLATTVSSGSGATAINTTLAKLNLFSSLGNGTNTFNGLCEAFFMWNRGLSAGEVLQMHQTPYRMFATPRRRIISGTGGAASAPKFIAENFNFHPLCPMGI